MSFDNFLLQIFFFIYLQMGVFSYAINIDDKNDTYRKKWIITKIEKPDRFGHQWSYKGYEGESEVTFDLILNENGTKIRVTHTALNSFPNEPHFNRERFEWGWKNLLGKNLKTLLEKGNL